MKFIPWRLYKQIIGNVPIACVDIAIVARGAVLLVRRKDAPARGEFWLPGGRVLKGEMMKDAAIRKASEEVGVECHVGPIVRTAETSFPEGPAGISVHSINSCFFMYPINADFEPALVDHHEDLKWIRRIPRGLHPYVDRCLLGAGLTK